MGACRAPSEQPQREEGPAGMKPVGETDGLGTRGRATTASH